ncbi:hypothetical protein CVT25_004694 [Psilocybe cyanescens]|uniref:DUF6534 domain-containing protein n=1 Tax=Psilocybe cyanescens TaxID=93625 RepID=A0A409XMS6_PSICY|nr:hypothetical protein CVT25_004694 [Psilocybe cyanescens]
MGSPLDSSFGIWLVIALFVIETFQAVLFFHITYFYLINGFGDFEGLETIYWRVILLQDSVQLLGTFLSAFIVQMYFGYCIYVLDHNNKILPGIIVVLALAQIGSGLGQVIITTRLGSFANLDDTKPTSTLQAASAFLCDITITGTLVLRLSKHKSSIKSTNSILTTLIINAVNRGVLTSTCALVYIILFFALPDTLYFFVPLELSGKLYMNSALAMLNSRNHTVEKAHSSDAVELNFTSMGAVPSNAGVEEGHVRILVTTHVSERELDPNYKTSTFTGGIL